MSNRRIVLSSDTEGYMTDVDDLDDPTYVFFIESSTIFVHLLDL